MAQEHGGDFRFLAGGQSLIPLLKLRIVSTGHVIDLNRIEGLDYVRKEDGDFVIGALARMSDVESAPLLNKGCPILSDCARQIADPLVRNLGTIGGNVCHADPTNDMPAVMVATGAEMVLQGPARERRVDAADFFLDSFTTALAEVELLKEVRVPGSRSRGSAYVKLERQAGDFGIVGVGACVSLGRDGTVEECGIGITGAGPTVVRAARSEDAIRGKRPRPRTISDSAKLASEDSRPVTDLRGTSDYKKKMVEVMTRRALNLAVKRSVKA